MSAPELHDCAVCENKTNQMCSACEAIYFCSRECQKLAFPVHRWLCTQPTDSFSFPPLFEEELVDLPKLRMWFLKTFKQQLLPDLQDKTGIDLDWATYMQILRSELPPPPFESSDPCACYIRNFLICKTRAFLSAMNFSRGHEYFKQSHGAWITIGRTIADLVSIYLEDSDEMPPQPFVLFNTFMRQYALFISIAYNAQKRGLRPDQNKCRIASNRLKEISDDLQVSGELREEVDSILRRVALGSIQM